MTSNVTSLRHLTRNILIAFIAGILVGLIIKALPHPPLISTYLTNGLFEIVGKLFIEAMKMLVIPIVFVSLVCGTFHFKSGKSFARIGIKTIGLYLITTAVAITLGLFFAHLFALGKNHQQLLNTSTTFKVQAPQSLKQMLISLIPANPIKAMTDGNMLQIIVFALLVGLAINLSGNKAENLVKLFNSANEVLIKLIHLLMHLAPVGVFCLLANVFSQLGFAMLKHLFGYFFTVILVLVLQAVLTYSVLLLGLARINPCRFFPKLYALMLFAFSTSSSNASIPITLETATEKLGIENKIAAFTIPLGATINMDGTAIMQGIATVFIANLYHIPLSLGDFATVILTATLASIGTAGVPGVGLIMLAMVLKQVGLPVEGIAIIIGIDRLLDMLRTAVNVTGDCTVAMIVAKSERALKPTTIKKSSA